MPVKIRTTFWTYTGRALTRASGVPAVQDVAVGLGRINRYAGASYKTETVLVHSLVVADLCPKRLEVHALLHDMTDMVFGDIPKPFKLPSMLALQNKMHRRFLKGFQLKPLSHADEKIIKQADIRSFMAEAHVIGPPGLEDELSRSCGRDILAENRLRYYMTRYPATVCEDPNGVAVSDFLLRLRLALRRWLDEK